MVNTVKNNPSVITYQNMGWPRTKGKEGGQIAPQLLLNAGPSSVAQSSPKNKSAVLCASAATLVALSTLAALWMSSSAKSVDDLPANNLLAFEGQPANSNLGCSQTLAKWAEEPVRLNLTPWPFRSFKLNPLPPCFLELFSSFFQQNHSPAAITQFKEPKIEISTPKRALKDQRLALNLTTPSAPAIYNSTKPFDDLSKYHISFTHPAQTQINMTPLINSTPHSSHSLANNTADAPSSSFQAQIWDPIRNLVFDHKIKIVAGVGLGVFFFYNPLHTLALSAISYFYTRRISSPKNAVFKIGEKLKYDEVNFWDCTQKINHFHQKYSDPLKKRFLKIINVLPDSGSLDKFLKIIDVLPDSDSLDRFLKGCKRAIEFQTSALSDVSGHASGSTMEAANTVANWLGKKYNLIVKVVHPLTQGDQGPSWQHLNQKFRFNLAASQFELVNIASEVSIESFNVLTNAASSDPSPGGGVRSLDMSFSMLAPGGNGEDT